ncbi:ammonia-forming cytochrome c nitrite reductase subunit c552 [Youngiibacter fragilis]|uniref:nitrite reductase (cytochrome; ammonia-forming) n=1 Tax=Youngiibacter fragilis 232.1 TaxID=994573 RepID=V7IBG3_9CLOT|nr:ammonia-forming cytochrome c nitrite reductase subunit c552 [Youngiibacter fragilis]ETA82626.1 nitrite reductase [Youngiibacter fragilis 232.1]
MRRKLLLLIFVSALFMMAGCSGKEDEMISAKDWQSKHPDVYATYLENSQMNATTYGGSIQTDYLEKHPYLKEFYEGYGFSVEYLGARGHLYALEDVIATKRPKAAASCLACKTSDFVALLNKEGIKANSLDFAAAVKEDFETISCYDCHKNEPGVVNVTRTHLTTALTAAKAEIAPGQQACAQCHVEYYLAPDTKEVILPLAKGFDTDDMLAYYDGIGYSDWIHPRTGTEMLKAQHPEFETYQGSIHSTMGVTCVTCHMPEVKGEKLESFNSHHWTSPLLSIKESCLKCHSGETEGSMTSMVESIQKGVYEKTEEVAGVIQQLITELDKAVKDGKLTKEKLDEVRELHRQAQFKWDFVFVENSEGFHNWEKSNKNLDEAKELALKALELLK